MRFELLVMLAVAVLVPSLSEGRIVSKCELREKLGQALHFKATDKILAKVICAVEKRTQFNTSRLTVIGIRHSTTVNATTPPGPAKTTVVRPVQTTGVVTTAIQPNQTATNGTGARARRHANDSDEDLSNEDNDDNDRSSFGLYGLFELTDRTACISGYRSTKNACQTQCDVFLDDDIGDDIACLVKTHAWEDLGDSRCSLKDLRKYFAECV